MFNFICSLIILGLLLVLGLAGFAAKRFGRGWSFQALFKDFNRKIWMTISLGAFFFTLYGLTVYLGASLAHNWGYDLFFALYRHPVMSVYAGLSLFAFLSLSIYLVRMFIKYLYLTRGKD